MNLSGRSDRFWVANVRTLILKPKIILMDEPFGALDPVTRHRMQDLLVALWRDLEATVFFITHDVSESVYLGDRVFILSNSPGTILNEREVPAPDHPAREASEMKEFRDAVREISELLDVLEEGADYFQRAKGGKEGLLKILLKP